MGILDDAIREHLDLKRKHGARDADIRVIEDEAFGSAERPDPFAAGELFNEGSATGTAEADPGEAPAMPDDFGDADLPGGLSEPDIGGEEPTRLVEPEALRPSEPASDAPSSDLPPEQISPPEGLDQIPGQPELPGQDEIPGQERLDDPLEGYQPSSEPNTPAPSESLEDLIAEEEPFPEDSAAPPPAPEDVAEPMAPDEPAEAPQDVPEESERPLIPEPESAVPDPPPPPPDEGLEPPGRARGRVDVPTQEHPPPGQTGGIPAVPDSEPEGFEPAPEAPPIEEEPFAEGRSAESDAPGLYDFETDEDSLSGSSSPPPDDDFEALGPAEEEAPYLDEEQPYAEEPASGLGPAVDEPGTEVRPALEDEETYGGPADDAEETWEEEEAEEGLWFEKGPPKDFDFDD